MSRQAIMPLLVFLLGYTAANASAQRLNLDAPPPATARPFVAALTKQATDRQANVSTGSVERELIRLGVAAMSNSDEAQILWGITLLERAAEVQAAVEAVLAPADQDAITAALVKFASGTDPVSMRMLLNRALAPLVRVIQVAKSAEGAESLAFEVRGLALAVQHRHAPEDAVTAATKLEAWLTSADTDPALALIAIDTVVDAAAVRKLLEHTPKWLGPEAVVAFEDAAWLALTAGPTGSPRQAAPLATVGAFARLVGIADGLADGGSHDVLCRTLDLACRPGLFVGQDNRDRVSRGEAWIRSAVAPLDEQPIIPQLRPAMAAAVKGLDRSRLRLVAIGAVMAASGRSMTDPEFLAARSSHAELIRRVELIARASAALSVQPGEVDRTYIGVANRMLTVWKAIDRKSDAKPETALFGQLLDEAARFTKLPREEAFVRSGAERDLKIAGSIKTDRESWIKKVSNPRESDWSKESASLSATAEVLQFLEETLSLRKDPAAMLVQINASGGWQVASKVWRDDVRSLQAAARNVIALLSDGTPGRAVSEVRARRSEFAWVLAALASARPSEDPGWFELIRTGDGSEGVRQSIQSWER